MNTDVTQALARLSDALAAQAEAAAPWVTAIRIGSNRHIAGIVWRADAVVTSDQALPAQDSYSLAGSTGTLLPARAARRDAATNLVCLNLDKPANGAHARRWSIRQRAVSRWRSARQRTAARPSG